MLKLINIEKDLKYANCDKVWCAYLSIYQNESARIEVQGGLDIPNDADKLILHRNGQRVGVTFMDGMMDSLDEKTQKVSSTGFLFPRNSQACLDDLARIQQIWTQEYPEIFEVDEYVRAHKDHFAELWADKYHLRHGDTFRILSKPPKDQYQYWFRSVIATEDEHGLRDKLFEALKDYAAGDEFSEHQSQLQERIFAADYLKRQGRFQDADAVRKVLFRASPVRGRMWRYLLKVLPAREIEPPTYGKIYSGPMTLRRVDDKEKQDS